MPAEEIGGRVGGDLESLEAYNEPLTEGFRITGEGHHGRIGLGLVFQSR